VREPPSRVQRGQSAEQHAGERALPLFGSEHRVRGGQRRRSHAVGRGRRVIGQFICKRNQRQNQIVDISH